MGALLAMLPEATVIHLAASGSGWRRARGGECVVAYEIGPGDYEAYVWGDDLDGARDGEPRDIESVRASWPRFSERLGPRA
jgi:hypothetical protein